MNRLLKKIVSGITTVSLGMAMVGSMPAIADGTAATSTVRTLSVDFMGRGDAPQESSPGSARLTADDIDKEFWVGVAVDNVNDLPLFTDGIYSLELAFEYDPDFVEPYFETNAAEAEWAAELESGNLAAANSSTWWNAEQYEIISVAQTDINTTTDRENADVMAQREADGWKMCTVCVTLKNGASFDGARFKDLADGAKQYLLKLPFKLNSVPADDAVDTNPRVLSLVRGPETLDIGSGETGTEPYSAWEATVTDPNDATNMKTLFTFPGDISLFDAGGAIEDIVPFKTETDAETGDVTETTYTLSTTKDLTLDGFKTETLDYYLSVPNETEKIKLRITSSELPTVTANTASVTATLASDKVYETAEFDLAELDKTVEADGYNNTVTVTAGGTTYTLHIRRLLKPKIELNYGNSPVGMIMSDDTTYPTEADKETAIADFKSTRVFSGVTSNLMYYEDAWYHYKGKGIDGADYNGDDDPTAMFVYQRNDFRDVGFTAYDAFGDTVDPAEVSISCTVTSYKGGFAKYTSADNPVDIAIEGSGNNYVFTNFAGYDIRPDVYDMEYKFTDDTGQAITATRKLIVISRLGDACIDVNNALNNLDSSTLTSNITSVSAKESNNSLYKFRVLDARMDENIVINNLDVSQAIVGVANGLPSFYNQLPKQ